MARKKKLSEITIDLNEASAFNIRNVFFVPNVGGDFEGFSLIIFKDGGKKKDTLYDLLIAYSKEHSDG